MMAKMAATSPVHHRGKNTPEWLLSQQIKGGWPSHSVLAPLLLSDALPVDWNGNPS